MSKILQFLNGDEVLYFTPEETSKIIVCLHFYNDYFIYAQSTTEAVNLQNLIDKFEDLNETN